MDGTWTIYATFTLKTFLYISKSLLWLLSELRALPIKNERILAQDEVERIKDMAIRLLLPGDIHDCRDPGKEIGG